MSIYVNSWSLCSWMLLSHLQHLSSFLLAPLLERWCSKEWSWQRLIKRWSAKEKSQKKEKMLFIIYYYLLIFILIIPVAWDLFSIDLGPGITSQWDAKNYGQEIVEIQNEKERNNWRTVVVLSARWIWIEIGCQGTVGRRKKQIVQHRAALSVAKERKKERKNKSRESSEYTVAR